MPLVASGGAGAVEHFRDVFQKAGVDAALAASVFHSGSIRGARVEERFASVGYRGASVSETKGERISAADARTLDFGKGDGLIPAVVQHAETGAVLMLGYMNAEALAETFNRRKVVFFSRSKQRLWMKGETSGHVLDLVEVRTDCDRDSLLVTARPNGPVCHVGTSTCFGDIAPAADSAALGRLAFLSKLEGVIEQRVAENPGRQLYRSPVRQGPEAHRAEGG